MKTLRPLSEEEVYNIIIKSSNATCSLDPIPTWLLKLCARELTPVIIKMINLPLSEGHAPDSWKVAILKPILKKYGLDLVFENFRPVSNLSFDAKATEKAVVNLLFEHCGDNAPFPTNQSSYRHFHSTETALLKVHNDILLNMDQQEVTLLVLFDIKSFLSHRKQRVKIKQEFSTNFTMSCGVSQGSCLGTVLFLLYVSPLFQIINKHLPSSSVLDSPAV